MTYTIQKDDQTFEVDDMVFFDDQPEAFRNAFEELRQGDMAEFDNYYSILLETGRIIITNKESE